MIIHGDKDSIASFESTRRLSEKLQKQKKVDNRPVGTLPYPIKITDKCDFSNSQERLIKGNIDQKTKERTYYIPNSIMYKTITIEEDHNDRLFCTEQEAQLQGWVKSKH